MKKIAILLFTFSTLLFSNDIKTKLMDRIIYVLFPDTPTTLFLLDENYPLNQQNAKSFTQVFTCKDADVVVTKNEHLIPKNCLEKKPYIFVTNYRAYIKSKKAIGAIFWQKGRLNLIFRKKRLNKLGLTLPKQYHKYLE